MIILLINPHHNFSTYFQVFPFPPLRTRANLSIWPEEVSTLALFLKLLSFNPRELLFLFWVRVCSSEPPSTTSLSSQSTVKAQWSKDFQGTTKQFNSVSVCPDGHSYLWSEVNHILPLAAVGYLAVNSPKCLVPYKSTGAVQRFSSD